jgi:hypothetical protein
VRAQPQQHESTMMLFRPTVTPGIAPPLRLGLAFFEPSDERAIHAIVRWLSSEQLPWQVVDERPFHALLLARGPRAGDAQHLAVLRLAADAERHAVARYGDAMPTMALRKPLQPMQLRIVLEMAAASLIPEHVAAASPQTRHPSASPASAPRRPATLL